MISIQSAEIQKESTLDNLLTESLISVARETVIGLGEHYTPSQKGVLLSYLTHDVLKHLLKNSHYATVQDGTNIIGFGILGPNLNRVCEIRALYSSKQSNGVGSRIMTDLIDTAVELRADYVMLDSLTTSQAQSFYKKHGFIEVGHTTSTTDGVSIDYVRMIQRL